MPPTPLKRPHRAKGATASRGRLVRVAVLTLVCAALMLLVCLPTLRPRDSAVPQPRHGASGKGHNADFDLTITAALSVLVQHDTAEGDLLPGQHGAAPLRRDQLPSWTLRVIEPHCSECFDGVTHGDAFVGGRAGGAAGDTNGDEDGAEARVGERASVFATPSAPLGLMGPLLFAMASVTDDVDVAAELAHWPWVTRSYAMQRGDARSGQRPRHLVVLGIPSTDQPRRYPLRDGQRATWLTFREVARRENDFTGALLPLYVFAAAERDGGAVAQGFQDVDALVPTADEYVAASAQRAAAAQVDDEDDQRAAPVLRRVTLRAGWREVAAGDAGVWQSPCTGVREAASSPALDTLAGALSLPVTPAYVAPATYVCHASTALWQEALRYRNALWIDMMTDLKPNSGKVMGMDNSWGMPTEVGMSQKVVIWLNYAYTAFPDVPYIMKGDDDMHLKVPQYLSDLRHAQGGWDRPRNLTATLPHGDVVPVTLTVEETPECLYRIWRIRHKKVLYGNGVGYLLDRRLVQAALNVFDASNRVLLKLLLTPYNPAWAHTYEKLVMQYEDVLVGKQVQDRMEAVRQVCPGRHMCYMSDRRSRVHALHRRPVHEVTWDSLLVHYGLAAMPYYVHHFHTNERRVVAEAGDVANRRSGFLARVDRDASAAMSRAVHANISKALPGFDKPPNVQWLRGPKRPGYVLADGDGIAVYDQPYHGIGVRGVDCFIEAGSK